MTLRDWFLILAASAIRLWLTAARTVTAIGYAAYDDRLFLYAGRSIAAGRWLGDYNEITLIKGPGYPLWIAFVSLLHLPLLFAQQLLYVLACVAAVLAIAPIVRSSIARMTLFVALLFNPMSFCDQVATRVIREGIYPALTLFVCAAVVAVAFRAGRAQLPWLILGGIAFTMLWHTREEGVWILPLLLAAVVILRTRIVIPALIFIVMTLTFIVLNGTKYGVYSVVELKQKTFLRAYASLTHVRRHGATPPPVPRAVRERVYAVSPAFAELRPYLEGNLGKQWAKLSQQRETGDIGGGAFVFAFRDAVAAAGYYKRGGRAVMEYYERLRREIASARRAGRIDAERPRATTMPPVSRDEMLETLRQWLRGCVDLMRFPDFFAEPGLSSGTEEELRAFAQITRSPLASSETFGPLHLTGWVLHVEDGVDITIENAPDAKVTRLPSPAVYEHLKRSWKDFPPAKHAGFDIQVPESEGAFLVLSLHGKIVERIPLWLTDIRSKHPDIRFVLDDVVRGESKPRVSAAETFRFRAMHAIARAYQLLFPPIFVLCALFYIVSARKRGATIAILIAALLGAVALRIFILALIEVTSFAALHFLYECPAYPPLILATFLMAVPRSADWWSRFRRSGSRETQPATAAPHP